MNDYDFAIVGSGFGASVCALRLSEKGYRVVVLEKGRRYRPEDFPRTNRDLRNWLWQPSLGLRGIFQMSFFRHVSILHGVGVGGGSLVYACTLPTPRDDFFRAPSWAALADWKRELEPHYDTARRMLGATQNPKETPGDRLLAEIARELGRARHHAPTQVGIYFGEPGERVRDPYFGGEGPERVGCTFCGSCMTGCRVGAKNTLDRNYLHLAERRGARVRAETEVTAVRERPDGGYWVETRPSFGRGARERLRVAQVVLAGGVLGTVPLLLRMREDREGLPRLSERVGKSVRTNSEALFGVVAPEYEERFNEGVAITSILHTDAHSHVEPVRYGHGSDFFRALVLPHTPGPSTPARLRAIARRVAQDPGRWLGAYTVPRDQYTERSQILLYMRTVDGTITLRLGRSVFTGFRRDLVSELDDPDRAPQAFMREATDIAQRFADKVNGQCLSLATETLLGSPTTAHILGGACMGAGSQEGVIDHRHRVFGYDGLYVVDGAAVSANPGVNPSLTITALAERAMQFIEPASAARSA